MISIVIPIYQQLDMTDACINSIYESGVVDTELILIDNGSIPPYQADHINATLIRNEANLGFPVAVNQGIKAASGDVIVLLNNDVICTQGWQERLLAHLDSYSIVGPLTNYAAGLQQVTIPVYQDEQELNLQAGRWAEEHKGQSQEVNWIIGFCMAFKKSLWEEIGPFDESLWPCSGEEVDFCMKAKAAGYKIGIVKDVYVHHAGSQTLNAMEMAGQVKYQELCYKNDRHLEARWGKGVFVQSIEKTACEDILGSTIKLNLGCGLRRLSGYINIDNRPEVNPDLVCDVLQGLPYQNSSVDEIRAHDFLEHIPLGKTIQVIEEIYRVLKPGGMLDAFTPSTCGRGAFQDPTHLSFWNKNSFLYFSDPECRALYNTKANFGLLKNEDVITNAEWKIIHTHVIARAIKEV